MKQNDSDSATLFSFGITECLFPEFGKLVTRCHFHYDGTIEGDELGFSICVTLRNGKKREYEQTKIWIDLREASGMVSVSRDHEEFFDQCLEAAKKIYEMFCDWVALVQSGCTEVDYETK